MTIVITGWRSQIAHEFRRIISSNEVSIHGEPLKTHPPQAERYLFCQGLLWPKRASDQTEAEVRESIEVNCDSIIRWCELILQNNQIARICIIGSESGYRGSFDGTYAAAKAMIHRYVETRRVGEFQQLVAISPGIVEDAGMTLRREDKGRLARRRAEHPKKRFLQSAEVASLARTLLYFQPFINNAIIRMHGGEV